MKSFRKIMIVGLALALTIGLGTAVYATAVPAPSAATTVNTTAAERLDARLQMIESRVADGTLTQEDADVITQRMTDNYNTNSANCTGLNDGTGLQVGRGNMMNGANNGTGLGAGQAASRGGMMNGRGTGTGFANGNAGVCPLLDGDE
jgi:hypothetical protein